MFYRKIPPILCAVECPLPKRSVSGREDRYLVRIKIIAPCLISTSIDALAHLPAVACWGLVGAVRKSSIAFLWTLQQQNQILMFQIITH